MAWTRLASELLELALPSRCVGCGAPGAALCTQCRPDGRPIEMRYAELPVYAAARYDGALRAAVLAYKERGRRELTGVLGAL
ncbi:MAG: ComF family protein, partial [Actinomycetes bacterium]